MGEIIACEIESCVYFDSDYVWTPSHPVYVLWYTSGLYFIDVTVILLSLDHCL